VPDRSQETTLCADGVTLVIPKAAPNPGRCWPLQRPAGRRAPLRRPAPCIRRSSGRANDNSRRDRRGYHFRDRQSRRRAARTSANARDCERSGSAFPAEMNVGGNSGVTDRAFAVGVQLSLRRKDCVRQETQTSESRGRWSTTFARRSGRGSRLRAHQPQSFRVPPWRP
jgi:hypothetical protein